MAGEEDYLPVARKLVYRASRALLPFGIEVRQDVIHEDRQAGPDVVESESHALRMAEALVEIARPRGVPLVFKASVDKANRTSVRSRRGPGLDELAGDQAHTADRGDQDVRRR